jgi:1-acyl-sn-glycerol-3-phosphate acyltransferase
MARDDAPWKPSALGKLARVADTAEKAATPIIRKVRTAGFPYRAPSVPRGVKVPEQKSELGADYDTEWARKGPARAARKAFAAGPLQLFVRGIASPTVYGVDRLADLQRLEDKAPAVIFAPNHHSHLDTPLMCVAIPEPWRHKLVMAAAADYFFDTRLKAVASALVLNAIPIDRESTSRRASEDIRALIQDGWSLVIYPEGGRSPDGWGQEFKGGAAHLSIRTGASVVPVFIDGTGSLFPKGAKKLQAGTTKVVFGAPLEAADGESTRRFNARIEAAVAALGDETLTDFWTARQRAAKGTSPSLTGPDYRGWRRQWALSERRKLGTAGLRRRQNRAWPDIGSSS